MPTLKLTKKAVDSLELPDDVRKPIFYRDEQLKGFGVKATSAGRKTFIIEKRVERKVKRITLGVFGELTVEQARKEAQKVLGEIAQGINPSLKKEASKLGVITLQFALDDYLNTRKDLKSSTVKDYQKAINTYLSDWKNKDLNDITKDMVEIRHKKIGERSHARANGSMRVLRAVYNHAINKFDGLNNQSRIHTNPVNRLSENRAWYPNVRKQTLLKPHELKPWYDATMQLNQEVTRDYLHFLLFTGLRRSEASRLTWANIDFNDKTFTIPDTKNNEPHTLPMSEFLHALLERRFSSSESIWVFPSPVRDSYLTEPRTAIERVTELSGISFTCHDLRRTFITIAESLDIPTYSLKRLLNHKNPNDVTSGYIIKNIDRLRTPMEKISKYILKNIEET